MINISLSLATALMFSACQPELEPTDPITPVVMQQGAWLSGRVIDTEGHPVPNAIVTDGFVHAAADENGCYRFESPYPDRVKYVSVRVPKEYRPVISDGRTVFFSSLPAYNGQERVADIVLEKRTDTSDNFTMLVIADPQAPPYNPKSINENIAYSSLDVWEDLFADMKNRVSNTVGECYGLCLGDIAGSTYGASVYAPYSIGMASLGIPFYQVIGNHDHFALESNLTDDDAAAPFEEVFGPRNYTFDLGQFHFVVIDNCIYEKGWRRYPFKYGLEDEFLEWLKSDLALVPKDVPVMICSHADFFDENGQLHQSMVYDGVDCRYKFEEFFETLQSLEFEKVYIWAGHTHITRFTGKVKTDRPSSNIEAYVLGRSAGGIGQEYLVQDGTPKGYVVLEASGKEIMWKYHAVTVEEAPFRGIVAPKYVWKPESIDESKQMNAYPRGSYDDDFVYANVWLWDPSWQTPVLKIGGKEYPMTHDYVYDLACKEIVCHYNSHNATATPLVYRGFTCKHGFSVRVPEDASGVGTVSVTDRWGRIWTHDVSVDPISYDDGMKHIIFDFRNPPTDCPESISKDVDFSCNNYDFFLSCGYYKKGENNEDNHVFISNVDSYMVLPAIPGHKLVGVTVRPAGNLKGKQFATITDMDGKTVVGGKLLEFYGNTTDTWTLEETQIGARYKIVSNRNAFNIGELRLAYRRVNTGGNPGSADKFKVDNASDVEF